MDDDVGIIVRDRRNALDLSQEFVAESIGTSSQQIGKLERGEARMTIDWLRKLSVPLQCRVVDLLAPTDKGEPQPQPEKSPALPLREVVRLADLVRRTLRSYYSLARERFDNPPAPEDFAREYSRQFESLALGGRTDIDDATIEVASGVAVTALRYASNSKPDGDPDGDPAAPSNPQVEELEEAGKGSS